MRDPDRIDRICQLLAEKWKNQPDVRLGQFLLNYIFHVTPMHDLSMHLQEDTITEKRLKNWEKIIEKMRESQKLITDFGGTSGS